MTNRLIIRLRSQEAEADFILNLYMNGHSNDFPKAFQLLHNGDVLSRAKCGINWGGFGVADLTDVIGYICKHDPKPRNLSRLRLTRLVYLSDWRHTLQTGNPMTHIIWHVYSLGPYADEVWDTVCRRHDLFQVRVKRTLDGTVKDVVSLVNPSNPIALSTEEKRAIDHVLCVAGRLNHGEFMRLVYSTYPVLTQPKHEPLNLSTLAVQYKREFGEIQV